MFVYGIVLKGYGVVNQLGMDISFFFLNCEIIVTTYGDGNFVSAFNG